MFLNLSRIIYKIGINGYQTQRDVERINDVMHVKYLAMFMAWEKSIHYPILIIRSYYMYSRSKVCTLPVMADEDINSSIALGILSEQFYLDVRRRQWFLRPSQQLVWVEQEGGGPLEKGLQERNGC